MTDRGSATAGQARAKGGGPALWMVVAAAAVVALAVVAYVFFSKAAPEPGANEGVPQPGPSSSSPRASTLPTVTAPAFAAHPLTPASATALAADLTSGNAGRVRAALSVPAAQKLDPALVTGLRAQAPLTVEQASFRQMDAASAAVRVRTGGPRPATWAATLVWERDAWRIALTTPAGAS